MGKLKNPRYEKFAQNMALGQTQYDAYRNAGFKATTRAAIDSNAYKLMQSEEVAARIKELQQKTAEKVGVTLETLQADCRKLIDDAMIDKQHTAASQTIERLAKISGLWIDKVETKTTNWHALLADDDA